MADNEGSSNVYLYTGATTQDAKELSALTNYIQTIQQQQFSTVMQRANNKMLQSFSGGTITSKSTDAASKLNAMVNAIRQSTKEANLHLLSTYESRANQPGVNADSMYSVNAAIAKLKRDYNHGEDCRISCDILRIVSTMAIPELDVDGLIKYLGGEDKLWNEFVAFCNNQPSPTFIRLFPNGSVITPDRLSKIKDVILTVLGKQNLDVGKKTVEDFKKSLLQTRERIVALRDSYKQHMGQEAANAALQIIDQGLASFDSLPTPTAALTEVGQIKEQVKTLLETQYGHYKKIITEVSNSINRMAWRGAIGSIGEYSAALMQDVIALADAKMVESSNSGDMDVLANAISADLLNETVVTGSDQVQKTMGTIVDADFAGTEWGKKLAKYIVDTTEGVVDPTTGKPLLNLTFQYKVMGKADTKAYETVMGVGTGIVGSSVKTYGSIGKGTKINFNNIRAAGDTEAQLRALIESQFPSEGALNGVHIASVGHAQIAGYILQLFGPGLYIGEDDGSIDPLLANLLTESYIDELFGGTGAMMDDGSFDWASKFVVNGFMVSIYDVVKAIASGQGKDFYKAEGTFVVPFPSNGKVSMADQIGQYTYQVEIQFGQALRAFGV